MKSLSTEVLAYQGRHHPFITLVVNQFTQCIEHYKVDELNQLKDALDHICWHAKSNTGLDISITMIEPGLLSRALGTPYRASVTIPTIASLNPLNPTAMKRFSEGDLSSFKPDDLLNGHIDYVNAKVSGFFSEIRYSMEFTTIMFDGRLSGEELAGIFMHELGHPWMISVMMGQSLVTSALCAGIVDFFNRYEDMDKRLQFGRMLLKNIDPKADPNVDVTEFVAVVLNTVDQRFENSTGLRFKPHHINELLADQFALRWGVGVSLTVAIKKLYAQNTYLGQMRFGHQWAGVLSALGMVYTIPWKSVLKVDFLLLPTRYKFIASGVMGVTYLVSMVIATLITEGLKNTINPHGTHPSAKKRIEALRRGHIALLQQKVSPTERSALLADIDAIDVIYNDVKEWDNLLSLFFNKITEYFSASKRAAKAADNIADRTHNRLHELTARLEALK